METNDNRYEELKEALNSELVKKIEAAGLTVARLTPKQEADLSQLVKEKDTQILKRMLSAPSLLYSNAERAVQQTRQDKATPLQWLAMLRKTGGIKAGEDKWLGLSEWLTQNTEKSLTKEDILQYIDAHRIILHEEPFGELEEMDDFKKLNEEFQDSIGKADEYWHEADEKLEEFYQEMKVKYDDDWQALMRQDEYNREEELQEQRDRYDPSVYDQQERAFQDMVDKYGSIFDAAFGYDTSNLTVGDEDSVKRFLSAGIIDDARLDNTTTGLDNYKELALWSENAKAWNQTDTIHFGEVGQGRCIGWIRFGETKVEKPFTTEEYLQKLDEMPKAEEWVREDGSKFVTGNDIYYPPTRRSPYVKSEFIADDKKNGIYLYYPLHGAAIIFSTLQEAVAHYNREHVPQTKRQKVLVIDEIQSNRHQKGRDKGYELTEKEMQQLADEYLKANEEKRTFQDAMREKYKSDSFGHYMSNDELAQLAELEEKITRLNKYIHENAQKIPGAPFEKNWHELCMKRMLRYAAENGYDRIAWTTGEQQAKRYNLARVVQEIERDRNYEEDKYFIIHYNHDSVTGFYVKPDGRIYDSTIGLDGKEVEEVFGKELTAKVMDLKEGEKLQAGDLTIGNKGMIAFYDGILPKIMNSYGKKWGMMVDELPLPHLSRANDFITSQMWMHSVEVTPAMKESVMQGQPLFMTDSQGVLYGCAVDDTIYLTGRGMNPGTLVHEYTHVWAQAMQHGNPEGWQSVKDLLRGTPLWQEVMFDPSYRDIIHNEDYVASEALARISGNANAHKLDSVAQKAARLDEYTGLLTHPVDVLVRLRKALETFWSWVGKHMFDIERFHSVEEVTDRVLYDLLNAKQLEQGKILHAAAATDNDRITHIHVFKGRGGEPYIRCKVDGVQQMGVPVKPKDREAVYEPQQLQALAQQYFTKALHTNEDTRSIKR